MIQQPELGKKIADYRKAKGWTQEELVDKCNLSVRTLQRIEAGNVRPRVYTLRLIFEALEIDYNKSLRKNGLFSGRLEQFYIGITDLFNLKTNTMRKITILTIAAFALIFGISSLSNSTFAQSEAKVRKIIHKHNNNFMVWFNAGDIESLVGLYRDDACLVSRGCGKSFIKNYYSLESSKYTFLEITPTDISVSDTLAVEKGRWKARLHSGEIIGGEYLSEWKQSGKKWFIVSESSGLSFN